MTDSLDLLFRWGHVIAGVMWIGHLWFFNFVNSQVAKTYDAESKKKVAPELMPRALYWFRWGAAFTFIFGVCLLVLVYYFGGQIMDSDTFITNEWVGMLIGFGLLAVGWVVYDNLWKVLAKQNPMVGAVVSWALITLVAFALVNPWNAIMPGRAMYIHIGAIFGTAMFLNVWVRIWPAQRKIIAAIKAGEAPPEGLGPLAGLRSKHNTYMSVPLIAIMVSSHWETFLDITFGSFGANWVLVSIIIAVGWIGCRAMYIKAASPAPAQY